MQLTLRATAGPHEGQEFTFSGHDTFIVGRSVNAHFRLPKKDMYFSRHHFMVEVNPPCCRIMDTGSRNGTHVNGRRVETADLQEGDEIKAGHTVLRVSLRDSQEEDVDLHAATQALAAAAPLPALPPFVASCPVCSAPPASPGGLLCVDCQAQADRQPQPISGYQLVRELGRGAMGIVSLGVRQADAALLAVKTITPAVAGSKAQVQRFLREADILRQLDHPNIVGFRDMGAADGQFYFAMDFIRGTDASRLVKQHGQLDVKLAVQLGRQVLSALAHAHAQGFVHRDIKPSNILIEKTNGRPTVKVADFGLARVYQASRMSGLTLTGDLGGTFNYLPPEQIMHYRDVEPAADQYSTAAMLYHLLTGKFIYDLPPQPHACIRMILQDTPIPIQKRRGDIPTQLAAVIHRALARQPKERYADANTFRKTLGPFAR